MDLIRANKVTAFWGGNGVAIAAFYKTHEKLVTVRSDDVAVMTAGFEMPQSTEDKSLSAAERLDSFKNFIMANAAVFGISYDPVDRRNVSVKALPSQFTEDTVTSYAVGMAESAISKILQSLQNNVIAKMIATEVLPENAIIQYGLGEGAVTVTEKYNAGNIKYATIDIPVTIGMTTSQNIVESKITVELISGQLKKPRTIGDMVLTMTGIKNALIDNGILPKPEPKSKAKNENESGDDADESDESDESEIEIPSEPTNTAE